MKKFALKIEDLRIDSFAVDPAEGDKGTVMARQAGVLSDPTVDSCVYTCPGWVTRGGRIQPCVIC